METYSGLTSPGIFTLPPGGIGSGAVLHADYTVVSEANPAKPGETIQIFLTGLGKVSGNVPAGAAPVCVRPMPLNAPYIVQAVLYPEFIRPYAPTDQRAHQFVVALPQTPTLHFWHWVLKCTIF